MPPELIDVVGPDGNPRYQRGDLGQDSGSRELLVMPSGDTTGVTDTATIQAALDTMFAAGGGAVILLAGLYWTLGLKLRSLVDLHGVGRQAVTLKVPTGQAAAAHAITLFDNTTYDYGVFDLTVDGGNGAHSNGSGGLQSNAFDLIHIDPSSGTGLYGVYSMDQVGKFERLLLVNSSGSGVYLGAKAQELRFRNVYVRNALVNSWNLQGFDCFFTDCTSGNSGEHGWALAVAAQNLQIDNCKSWSSGQNVTPNHRNDWNILGSYNTLVNCVAEGAMGYGFSIGGTQNKVSGVASGALLALVDMFQMTNCDVDIMCASQNNPNTPGYVVRIDGSTSTGNARLRGNPGTTTGTLQQIVGSLAGLNLTIGQEDGGSQSIAFAASITPNPYLGNQIDVGLLTGPITINNPSQGHLGSEITLWLTQDGTGGRTVTFGANYKTTAAIPTTLNSVTAITFRYDGTNWRESSRATT